MAADHSIIALTTDFGSDDIFAGVMKGVILGINPAARIVDVTHSIGAYNVLEAAYKVRQAAAYFPEGTVHLVVVDPGVGSARKVVALRAAGQVFVAPDNGALTLVAERGADEVVEVREKRYFLPEVSGSFHGRDIFAPVGAHISKGLELSAFGPPLEKIVRLDIPRATERPDGAVMGRVLWRDHFGNLVTNIPAAMVRGECIVRVGRTAVGRVRGTYADVAEGQLLAMIGSFGQLEIAERLGDAAARLRARPGDAVTLTHARGV